MASSNIRWRWLLAKIMSNWIPVSGLKQRDGHVPSMRMVLDTVLSVRLSLQESMKNPHLNGDNRATSIGSLHRRRGRRIFIFLNAVRSVRMILSSRMSEKANERTDGLASFSVDLWNPKGGEIQFGREFARHSLDTRPRFASTRSAGMWNEPARRTTGN